jgi:hypothetical protein
MKILEVVKSVTLVLVSVALAACSSFVPVYGDRSGANMQTVRFNFTAPDSRLEQIIIDRLKLVFPAEASPQDPVLDIVATLAGGAGSASNAFPVSRPSNFRVQATVTIVQDDALLFSETRFADSGFQGNKLTPTDLFSSAGAQESAARAVADSIRAAIISTYVPGRTESRLPEQ